MSGQSQRVFVGNLPHSATKDEILSKFKDYGTVESVEIRTKKDPSTGEPLATFSFVNINADRESLNQCAMLLNGIKIGGRNIKVELAKESFLQRLQRERQEGNKTAPPAPPAPQPSLPPKKAENVIKKPIQEIKITKKKSVPDPPESSDSEDDKVKFHHASKLPMFKGIKSPIASELESKPPTEKKSNFSNPFKNYEDSDRNKRPSKAHFPSEDSDILKKFELFSDVWKDDDEPSNQNDSFGSKFSRGGRNQSMDKFSNRANNWPSQNQPHTLQASNVSAVPKSVSVAEQKRLKSLDEKRQALEQQKNAVKSALSDQSAPKINSKIVFGDDDEPEILHEKQPVKKTSEPAKGKKPNALTLFDESDDEAAADDWKNQFEVKKQFQGEKGKKLLQLQSNFNNDRRFNLDERFYEGETIAKPAPKPQTTDEDGVPTAEGIEGMAEEREQQLQILSSILGQSIPTTQPISQLESKTKGMLRFDPSKPNHLKFELAAKEPKEKKRKKKHEEEDDEAEAEDEDRKRKFRREEKEPEPVSKDIFYNVSNALAESLKQAKEGQGSGFSLLQMFGSSSGAAENENKETAPSTKPLRKELKKRPVLDDSSSDEEGPTAKASVVPQDKAVTPSNPGIRSSHGVWQECFFLQSDDSRLKEGLGFFNAKKRKETPEDMAAKRHSLVQRRAAMEKRLDKVWKRSDILKPRPHRAKAASNNKVHHFKPLRKGKKLGR